MGKITLKQASEWMSATKVNTYAGSFGCPRKFFNKYIAKLKQKPSINFPIGNVPHKTLEFCFKHKLHLKTDIYSDFRQALLKLHDHYWQEYLPEIQRFNPNPEELDAMYQDSRRMIINWLGTYLREDPQDPMPWIEKTFWARDLKLMCRIDRGMKGKSPGVFHIIDYKCGKSNKIYTDTKLQLIINWICYREETGNTRHKVGAHFLRYPEAPQLWTPTQEEIQWALDKVEFVRKNTRSIDINDYPCTCGGRCQKGFILNENDGCKTTPAKA